MLDRAESLKTVKVKGKVVLVLN